MRRRTNRQGHAWPRGFKLLVQALEVECPPEHVAAFRAFVRLALVKVPSRGIFDPTLRGEAELDSEIERIARRHLGLSGPRDRWSTVLRQLQHGVGTSSDMVESAATEIWSVSDTAYFLLGLSMGLVQTFAFTACAEEAVAVVRRGSEKRTSRKSNRERRRR
jgi:hypothetical protein